MKSVLLTAAFAVFALAAQNQPTSATNSASYSAGSKEDLSRLAGQMLDNTNKARTALRKGDYQSAKQDVNQALADLQRINARAHGATMIPVYQEFVSISVLTPVRAEQNARREAASRKNSAPATVSNNNAVVHQVAGDYTWLAVNTTIAKNGLDTARAAFEKNDWKMADSALSDVQDGVQMQSIESDLPLSRARENLIVARAAARQGNYSEASASLRATSKALSQYAAEGGSHAGEARQIQRQIDEFARNMQQHADAVAKINAWWNTTSAWSPYESAPESAHR